MGVASNIGFVSREAPPLVVVTCSEVDVSRGGNRVGLGTRMGRSLVTRVLKLALRGTLKHTENLASPDEVQVLVSTPDTAVTCMGDKPFAASSFLTWGGGEAATNMFPFLTWPGEEAMDTPSFLTWPGEEAMDTPSFLTWPGEEAIDTPSFLIWPGEEVFCCITSSDTCLFPPPTGRALLPCDNDDEDCLPSTTSLYRSSFAFSPSKVCLITCLCGSDGCC